MKVVGLTGGIGSGKTTVASFFKELGIPIYIADIEAKKLMNDNLDVRSKICELLGDKAYDNDQLNTLYIADQVFSNKNLLQRLNKIVHPAVGIHFEKWKNNQKSPYVIKEAAILFENGGYLKCDHIILVTAPQEIRINRVLNRDDTTREKILHRINNQWSDVRKIPLSDYVITNINMTDTKAQILKIHLALLA